MWLKGTSVPGIKLQTAMVYTISITTSTPDKRDCSRVTCSNVPVLLVLKITALWLNWRLLCHQISLWNLEILWQSKYFCSLTLIGMRQGGFPPLIPTQDTKPSLGLWQFGPRLVLCPSGFIIFCLLKNMCTLSGYFKHPIGGVQLPKNRCEIL